MTIIMFSSSRFYLKLFKTIFSNNYKIKYLLLYDAWQEIKDVTDTLILSLVLEKYQKNKIK